MSERVERREKERAHHGLCLIVVSRANLLRTIVYGVRNPEVYGIRNPEVLRTRNSKPGS